jgi:hypothetical protein
MSSPIGLGHARRDLAIVDELRKLRPGLEVHWLAQHPVTELLKRRSEHIHSASAFLASESGHIESEAAEHDLHACGDGGCELGRRPTSRFVLRRVSSCWPHLTRAYLTVSLS